MTGGGPQQAPGQSPPPGLFARPVLALDPGMHTAPINRADVDRAGRRAFTGSDDRTVRIWDVATGRLRRTIRLPVGPGDVGKVYAVAIDPDGARVAAGGWLGTPETGTNIYLFDADTGAMVHRIAGLPEVVFHLAFSPDRRILAASFGRPNGVRVFSRAEGWAEIARDTAYGDDSYGAAFAPDGRLARTSLDGKVRLYDDLRPADGTMAPAAVRNAGHPGPFGLAFNPRDGRLAVGFDLSPALALFDGTTLAPLPAPDTAGMDTGDLSMIAWSRDGATLYAGGRYHRGDGIKSVVAWDDGGAGARREIAAGRDTLMSLLALPDGGVLAAAQDPWLGVLGPDGSPRWPPHQAPQADFRNQRDSLAVSADGITVDFGFEQWGKGRARFDLATLSLTTDPPATAAPPARTRPASTSITRTPSRRRSPARRSRLPPTRCPAASRSIRTATASSSGRNGPSAPSPRTARRCGRRRPRAPSGR